MIQRFISFVVTVLGVLFALLVGFWALLSLAFVALGAAIVYAFRSRGWGQARKKHRGEVIEGEFSVVDEAEGQSDKSGHQQGDSHSRLP